ncbi:carbohydrate kinase family protein [Paludibacter sp. 221]|uniref:carbohydrate kinase family protein n=1 Tax=Paludibacter sp. 221 TaxID=2302939 RepID=UPI0013D3D3BB|nr:carbohydrate kinase family protein [Paludibacter sp. 221]NDV46083.1 carbohydrate kinase family protein [Paludibacter sp. 221]
MKKFDVIAIGELNVDLILNNIDGQPEIGKEKFAKDMIMTLGSSTAIFAANTASLGTKTAFVGMIGKDNFGKLVKDSLKAKGVDTSLLIETDKGATGATIVLNYNEDRANVTYQGTMDMMSFADIDKAVFDETKHIHISSVFMQSGIKRDLIDILKFAQSKGVTTSLDTQWDPVEAWDFDYAKILPLVSVFMPNEKELLFITRSANLEEAINKIKPYINLCVIKRGNQGSLLVAGDGTSHNKEAFLNTNVVDAIGAGDSFNAGFINQFVQGKAAAECQAFGNLTGAINTTAAGGTGAFISKENIVKTAKEVFGQTILL